MSRGRGQLRGRGRGRGGRPFGGPIAVDRRSTCINASGFEREDKEEVLAHFAVSLFAFLLPNLLYVFVTVPLSKLFITYY